MYTQNVGLLNTICRGLFPPVFVTVHASIRPSVMLHLQVTCGTSRWESSSFICQLAVIEQQADSKHSCSSAGIVTLASADMSVHTHCAARCFIICALNLTTQTHKYKFKIFSWSVMSHFTMLLLENSPEGCFSRRAWYIAAILMHGWRVDDLVVRTLSPSKMFL